MKIKPRRGSLGALLLVIFGLTASDAHASAPADVPIRPPTYVTVRALVLRRSPVARVGIDDLDHLERTSERHCRYYDASGRLIDIDEARLLAEGLRDVTCEVLSTVRARRNVRVPFEREPQRLKRSPDRRNKRDIAMAAGFYGEMDPVLMPTPAELKKFGRPNAARKYTRHGKKRR